MIGILPLFCQAKLIDEAQMYNVSLECGRRDISAGKFLVESGAMSPELVRAGILGKLLLSDGLITMPEVTRLLRLVAYSDMRTEEALSQLGWSTERSLHIKLTQEILVGTGMILEQVYADVKENCAAQEMLPLAVLVENRLIGAAFADDVILLIKEVMEQKISFQEVTAALDNQNEAVFSPLQRLEILLEGVRQKSILIGQLILAASWITPRDLVRAAEIAVCKKQQIGSVLLAQGAISEVQLNKAVEIQRKIHAKTFSVVEGIAILEAYGSKKKSSSGSTKDSTLSRIRKSGSKQPDVAQALSVPAESR